MLVTDEVKEIRKKNDSRISDTEELKRRQIKRNIIDKIDKMIDELTEEEVAVGIVLDALQWYFWQLAQKKDDYAQKTLSLKEVSRVN